MECRDDTNCSTGYICESYECIPGVRPKYDCDECTSDAQCPSGTKCRRSSETAPYKCRKTCTSNTTCTSPYSGTCGTWPNPEDSYTYCGCP
jgi:hypothetical protein